MAPPPLPLGPPVEGSSFFPRPEPLARLWNLVGTGHDVLLLDPRRVGKTSLLRAMRDRATPGEAFEADVASAEDEAALFKTLYDAAAQVHAGIAASLQKGVLLRRANRVLKVGVATVSLERIARPDPTWRELAEEYIAAVRSTGNDCLLLIDELPVFLQRLSAMPDGLSRVDALLAWLRTARQAPGTRIRWIFAGSIGLDTLVYRWGMSRHINDLRVEHVGAFSIEEAHAFVDWAAKRLRLQLRDGERDAIVARVGWPIPYHLGLVVQEVSNLRDGADEDRVSSAISRLLVDREQQRAFKAWEERLDQQLSVDNTRIARAILHRAAEAPEGASAAHVRAALRRGRADVHAVDEAFAYICEVLRADGYLTPDGARLQFRSPLLREWWASRGRGR